MIGGTPLASLLYRSKGHLWSTCSSVMEQNYIAACKNVLKVQWLCFALLNSCVPSLQADWGKPLAELFLFDEALEGIAVEKLLPHLNEDVRAQLHDVGTQVLPALKRLTEDTSGRD